MESTVDLETLLPSPKTVIVHEGQEGEKKFTITPFRWKQFRDVTKLVQTIDIPLKAKTVTGEDGEEKSETEIDLLKLVSENGEEITGIIEKAIGENTAYVDDLDLDDVISLAAAVLEVNRDFFSQKLAPKMRALAARLSAGRK